MDALPAALKEKGIPTMLYYPRCMHQQSAFADIAYHGECAVAEHLCSTVLSMPIHPYLEEKQVRFICDNVIALLSHRKGETKE